MSKGRIGSIDGLRGVAVLLVILAHVVGESWRPPPSWHTLTVPLTVAGGPGVEMFFVLSGFLITSILVNESQRSGRVSLKSFYVRRTLRIWPAFYVFLVALAVLAAITPIDVQAKQLLVAGLFLHDYSKDSTWWVGHTWSLAIEEQFYLVWPVLLVLLRRRRGLWFCVLAIGIVPGLRVLTYFVAGPSDLWRMAHTRADSLFAGCALALFGSLYPGAFRRLQAASARWRGPLVAALVLVGSVLLTARFGGKWLLTVGYTVETLAVVVIMVEILRTGSRWDRVLSNRFLRWVGAISFSLYLWQQIFLGPIHFLPTWAAVPSAFGVATLSYLVVERPFLRLKRTYETSSSSRSHAPVETRP